MESENKKFLLPRPVFADSENSQMRLTAPHFLTPQGMLLPKQMQPPPMYGPRGATIPPKYFREYGKQSMVEYANQKDEQHFCDVCDRSFNRLQDFENHNKEHRECGVDGCTFFAHSSVINAHIEQQHETGLYDSIKKLSTPEEIAAWREERKKRYPTKANVELRQKIQQEKFKRGEKLSKPKNRFGQKSDRERAVNRNDKFSDNRKRKNLHTGKGKKRGEKTVLEPTKPSEKLIETTTHDSDTEEPPIKLFAGTGSLENYAYKKPKIEKNALSSLVGMYGSDDDSNEDSCDEEQNNSSEELVAEKENISESLSKDDDKNAENPLNSSDNEAAEEIPFIRMVCASLENEELGQAGAVLDSSDNEAPEEVPFTKKVEVFKEEVKVKDENKPNVVENKAKANEDSSKKLAKEGCSKKKTRKVQTKKSGLDYSKLYKTRQNTMLEKLLQPEIIHERNVLLQCVRFVVENNFFGVGEKCEVKEIHHT